MADPFFIAGLTSSTCRRASAALDLRLTANELEELLKNGGHGDVPGEKGMRKNFQFSPAALNSTRRFGDRSSWQAYGDPCRRRGSSVLHYQPQVELRSRRLTGMEGMICWQHPTRGLLPPSEFVNTAEDCGLIHGLSHWVLEEACKQNAAWQADGLPRRRVAVNISSVNFKQGNFCQAIAQVLEATGLSSCYLELEVTETLLLQDEQVAPVSPRAQEHGPHVIDR